MKFLYLNKINTKMVLLVLLAALPALLIFLYSGMEQRRRSIEDAKSEVLMLTHTMAETQKNIALHTKYTLSTVSLMPAIQSLDLQKSADILETVLKKNPNLADLLLLDLDGDVLVSGRIFPSTNLADRKYFRDALARKDFAAGEYMIARSEESYSAFAFAYPLFDEEGMPKAVLTAAIKLRDFAQYFDFSNLPPKSFVSITDHQGIRLYYYPPREKTNPVGKPITAGSWQVAANTEKPGTFFNAGSDGLRRIFAFEQVRLTPGDDPYLYVWAGIPEAHILEPANSALIRNLLLMLMAVGIALFLSWAVGKKTLVSPIQGLVGLTQKFAAGNLKARSEYIANTEELAILTNSFHDMADTLLKDQTIKNDLIKKLEKALAEIKTLQGVLPICQHCQKIRDDLGAWQGIEKYVREHSEVNFSHGICPDCAEKHYPDLNLYGNLE